MCIREALPAFTSETLRLRLLFEVLCLLCCHTRVPACRIRHTPQHSLPICPERHCWEQPNPELIFSYVSLPLGRVREEAPSGSESQAPMARLRFWFHRPPKSHQHSWVSSGAAAGTGFVAPSGVCSKHRAQLLEWEEEILNITFIMAFSSLRSCCHPSICSL